jgi:hypothetical protein
MICQIFNCQLRKVTKKRSAFSTDEAIFKILYLAMALLFPGLVHIGDVFENAVIVHGGKQQLASRIPGMIPEHQIYCEPFCGGARYIFCQGTVQGTSHPGA